MGGGEGGVVLGQNVGPSAVTVFVMNIGDRTAVCKVETYFLQQKCI